MTYLEWHDKLWLMVNERCLFVLMCAHGKRRQGEEEKAEHGY